jgi:hypothetical protein
MKINKDLNSENEHMTLNRRTETQQGPLAYLSQVIGKLRERIRHIGQQSVPDQFIRVTEKFDVVHRIGQHRQ